MSAVHWLVYQVRCTVTPNPFISPPASCIISRNINKSPCVCVINSMVWVLQFGFNSTSEWLLSEWLLIAWGEVRKWNVHGLRFFFFELLVDWAGWQLPGGWRSDGHWEGTVPSEGGLQLLCGIKWKYRLADCLTVLHTHTAVRCLHSGSAQSKRSCAGCYNQPKR